MASSPEYKVYNASGQYQAAIKRTQEAFSAAESYDRVARIIAARLERKEQGT